MSISNHKITDKLFLIMNSLDSKAQNKVVETGVNHIMVIDCSGSMSDDLPKIREQLKAKLPKMLTNEKDTFSIIWFSGKGQFGTLLAGESVAGLNELKTVNEAIDRWLKPVGMTGFKEPIEEISVLVKKVSEKNKNPFSLFFMSDGCDNQWSHDQIIKAVEHASRQLNSCTFVEYGLYADRNLLSKMAEKTGGKLIYSENFEQFIPALENKMSEGMFGKRVERKIDGDIVAGFAFAINNGDLLTFDAANNKILIPENLDYYFYLSSVPVGMKGPDLDALAFRFYNAQKDAATLHDFNILALRAGYGLLSLMAVRMKSDIIFPVLKSLGDVKFIKQFTNCFGKQKYTDFMKDSLTACNLVGPIFTEGRDPNLVPPEDAFTVLDLLKILSEDENNRMLLDHPAFKYKRISRGRESAEDLPELDFQPMQAPDGYSISSLTYKEDRPNISILVKKLGSVNIAERLQNAPSEVQSTLSPTINTFIWRNYAIVKDGFVNVDTLPVVVTPETYQVIVQNNVKFDVIDTQPGKIRGIIDMKSLPIINRKMVKEASAKTLFDLEWELVKARCAQKVYKYYREETQGTKTNDGFQKVWGKATADWLFQQGINENNGYAPTKTKSLPPTDAYMSKVLESSLKGYKSDPPSVNEVLKKIAGGKNLTGYAAIMADCIKDAEDFKSKNPAKLHEAYFEGKAKASIAAVRGLIHQIVQIKFAVVVGQVWFKEFKTLEENTMKVNCDGQELLGTIEMYEEEVKI